MSDHDQYVTPERGELEFCRDALGSIIESLPDARSFASTAWSHLNGLSQDECQGYPAEKTQAQIALKAALDCKMLLESYLNDMKLVVESIQGKIDG